MSFVKRHDVLLQNENPTDRQRGAADPAASVWVSASAGTGKTKVLTDRTLRLLLPRPDGQGGSDPHRILCLTYTKAAASEMALRIGRTLSTWATVDDEKLDKALHDLLGRPANDAETQAARRLFARVVDAPGGLKIMTIHSFCQRIIVENAVEAGLDPGIKVADEVAAEAMFDRAFGDWLTRALSSGAPADRADPPRTAAPTPARPGRATGSRAAWRDRARPGIRDTTRCRVRTIAANRRG